MNKLLTISGLLALLWLLPHTSLAQGMSMRSQDFERKGVYEYISVSYLNPSIGYWTSERKETIELEVNFLNAKEFQVFPMEVNFPGDPSVYHLDLRGDRVLCRHPDGREQWYDILPTVYRSADYEQPGLVEYIQIEDNTFIYFTSRNPENKIPLQVIDVPVKNSIQVKFPGAKDIYSIEFLPVCFGDLLCIHPDGSRQRFAYYFWKDELK